MNKFVSLVMVAIFIFISGCATSYVPLVGNLFSADVKGPIAATANEGGSKVGTSTATMLLGISSGDGSVETAAKNGGITKIKTVDVKINHVLGIYVAATTIVTGE